MHERREVFAQADRVDNRKADFSGRQSRQESQHGDLQQVNCSRAFFSARRLDQHGQVCRKRQHGWQGELRLLGNQFFIFWQAVFNVLKVQSELAQSNAERNAIGGCPIAERQIGPLLRVRSAIRHQSFR